MNSRGVRSGPRARAGGSASVSNRQLRQGTLRLVVKSVSSDTRACGSRPPVCDDSIFEADNVFVSHWHFDHFDVETLRRFHRGAHLFVPRFVLGYARRLPELAHHGLLFRRVMRCGVGSAAETVTRIESA